jgi:elongator complex protein 1
MRNLQNILRSDVDFSTSKLPLSAIVWASENSLVCSCGPAPTDSSIQLYRVSQINNQYGIPELITSWDAPCPSPDLESDTIVSLHYFQDSESFCVVLAGGDIIQIRENPLPGEDEIEILGTVNDGIASASWSPDESFLAICTQSFSFLLMTRDFDPIADVKFALDDIKATKHVSVGWGKAETQFKGKRAKSLRDPTVPEKIDQGLLSPLDDGAATVSWRGDGEYVAVNAVDGEKRRMVRVFTKEGVLDSVSEPVDYLESALSWKPSGNLIAGIKQHTDKAEVVFFERNGLRHGEFDLRVSPKELKDWASTIKLEWNSDSSALAVIFNDRVEIWTMGNYYYYLKQTIILPSSSRVSQNANICWSLENPLLFSLHHSGGFKYQI